MLTFRSLRTTRKLLLRPSPLKRGEKLEKAMASMRLVKLIIKPGRKKLKRGGLSYER